MKLKHLSLSVMLMGATAAVLSGQALASGYHFGSQSVSGQGTSQANGAEANDASVIFYNPAGMSRLQGTQFSGGLTLVLPDSEYQDKGSTRFTGTSTGGGNGGSFAPDAVVAPSLYLSHQVNDKVNVGVGIFVPFGAKLDYDNNWAGRYGLQNIDLETLNINPSISYKFDEHHSVGFGLSAQYMKAKLQKAVDVPGSIAVIQQQAAGGNLAAQALVGQIAAAAGGLANAQALLAGAKDGQAGVEGDDWGYGFNLGYLFQLDDATRFGLAYRSQIKHKLTGDAKWTFNNVTANQAVNAIIAASSGHVNSGSLVNVDTPESVSANFYHDLNDRLALMGDLTWTRHSRMDSIDIKFTGTSEGDLVIKQQWKDTYKVSFGANYKYSDSLLLRGGVAYDQSPVKNDGLRHPALPDSDRYWFSLGANYKLTKQSSVDLAYSYVDFKDSSSNYKDSCTPLSSGCTGNGETTKGDYKTHLQFVGVQYNYRF